MPSHKSAKKQMVKSRKAQVVNRDVRTEIRGSLKKIRMASKADATKEIPNFFSLLDKAARRHRGGISRNAAANYKRKAHLALAKAK